MIRTDHSYLIIHPSALVAFYSIIEISFTTFQTLQYILPGNGTCPHVTRLTPFHATDEARNPSPVNLERSETLLVTCKSLLTVTGARKPNGNFTLITIPGPLVLIPLLVHCKTLTSADPLNGFPHLSLKRLVF